MRPYFRETAKELLGSPPHSKAQASKPTTDLEQDQAYAKTAGIPRGLDEMHVHTMGGDGSLVQGSGRGYCSLDFWKGSAA